MPTTSSNSKPSGSDAVRKNTEALVELTAAVVRMTGLQGNGLARTMLAGVGAPTAQPTDKHAAEQAKRYWAEKDKEDKDQRRAEAKQAKREQAAKDRPVGDVRSILGLLAKRAGAAVAPGVASYLSEPARAGDSTGRLAGKAAAQLPGAALGMLGKAALGVVAVFAKVAGALAPLALLGAALGSSTSGFGVFMTSIRLMGTVLGALLLPFFIVMAAAVFAVSTYLMDALLPALGDYYALVIGSATQAVDILSAAFETAKTVIMVFAESVGTVADTMVMIAELAVNKAREIVSPLAGGALAGVGSLLGLGGSGGGGGGSGGRPGIGASIAKIFEENMRGSKVARESGGKGDPDKTLSGRFQEGLTASIQELRRSMGPQAQTFGIAQASRQAQLAALNQSPFEAKMLSFTEKVLQKMEEAIAKQRPAVTNG